MDGGEAGAAKEGGHSVQKDLGRQSSSRPREDDPGAIFRGDLWELVLKFRGGKVGTLGGGVLVGAGCCRRCPPGQNCCHQSSLCFFVELGEVLRARTVCLQPYSQS